MRRYRVAYCAAPKIGGTYNFFRRLQKAVGPRGGECLAVTTGERESRLWDPDFATEDCRRLCPKERSPFAAAQALVNWVKANDIDVFVPMSSAIGASAVPHLPDSTHVIARCGSITRHAYDIVTFNPERIEQIVVTSQRQRDDLLRRGVSAQTLRFIPHGVELEPFIDAGRKREGIPGNLRMGYVGRLEHADKGCFYLAEVMREISAAGVRASLDIIGDGPDRGVLEGKMFKLSGNCQVRFHGQKTNAEIAGCYAELDVFLLTSHFEGFPNSLVEAMASGCVPVASRIRGVTDWIIEHGKSGFVCDVGDYRSMAGFVRRLAEGRGFLRKLSQEASRATADRFSLDRMGTQYDDLFHEVISGDAHFKPKKWESFRAEASYTPTWRRFVPVFMKTWARRQGVIA
jgi:glycosyltransferase involved in cell wall biosynthesis